MLKPLLSSVSIHRCVEKPSKTHEVCTQLQNIKTIVIKEKNLIAINAINLT